MTTDAMMKLLRALLSFAIGYASAKGYLTPTDANAITQFCIEVGPILIPAALALWANWNQKSVPQASIAVTADNVHPASNVVGNVVNVGTAKIVGALLIGFIVLTAASSAQAQTRKPQLTGNIVEDIKANTKAPGAPSVNQDLIALYGKLQAVSLVDLKYALNIANKKNNQAAGQCWTAIITQIEQDQTANVGPDGQPLPTPDPHLFTDVERLSDVINSLGPNSPLMVGCGSFANQAKMNVLQLLSTVLAGGVGLAAFAP